MLISCLQCNQKGAQYRGLCTNLKRTLFSLLVLTLKAVKCWMRWWFNGCSLRMFCFFSSPCLERQNTYATFSRSSLLFLMVSSHGSSGRSTYCIMRDSLSTQLVTWIVLLFPLSTSPSLLSDKSSSRILTDCVCLNYFKLLERETIACLNIELLLPVHRSEKQNLDWKHENVCLC